MYGEPDLGRNRTGNLQTSDLNKPVNHQRDQEEINKEGPGKQPPTDPKYETQQGTKDKYDYQDKINKEEPGKQPPTDPKYETQPGTKDKYDHQDKINKEEPGEQPPTDLKDKASIDKGDKKTIKDGGSWSQNNVGK